MAKKLHGRRRRYLPVGNERGRKPRIKTFLTEDAAEKHAEKLKLKNYKILKTNYGLGKKYKIVI